MLEMASQTVAESIEQFRTGDGDGEEEEDGEETLDPRVKVRLQLHTCTCSILVCGVVQLLGNALFIYFSSFVC